jgi:hypothetical protein
VKKAPPAPAIEAARVARVAVKHPDCLDAQVTSADAAKAVVTLQMNVDMPLAMAAVGCSGNGVRVREPVEMTIRPGFPWRHPIFRLRCDFPRDLPHIQPDPVGLPPRPCLVDGSEREYFAQFGLAEAGVFHLLQQLSGWLRKAAVGDLINKEQGWEPVLRNTLDDHIALSASFVRGLVNRDGGWKVLKADYYRVGGKADELGTGASVYIVATSEAVALKAEDASLFTARNNGKAALGDTVVAVIWPDKLPSGKPLIADHYLPETVCSLGELRARAEALGCARSLDGFLASLERKWAGYVLDAPMPVGVVLCARRPIELIGSNSNIELIPYVLEFRASPNRHGLFAKGDAAPVKPAGHIDAVSPELMRQLSGSPQLGAIAILGCGSVGSKIALHAARGGQVVASVADERMLGPHHMARHALLPSALPGAKANELAKELAHFAPAPFVFIDDLVIGLRDPAKGKRIIPGNAAAVINTTASIPVREALVEASARRKNARMFETALVGNGHGAFLLAAGLSGNPNPCDLMAELYATVEPDSDFHRLMFDAAGGLQTIQIGQGCGSMTLQASDVAISAMTAGATDELLRIMNDGTRDAAIVIGVKDAGSASTTWTKRSVLPFEIVPIEGSAGWTLRMSRRVIDEIQEQVRLWPRVETGGVIIGTASARLKTVTVVDWIDAPPDSKRSAAEFMLGTAGLQVAIQQRHASSGQTLYDVGTWHSHLQDQGPSPTDWGTARALAAERVPPAVLLIASPKRFYALQALREGADGG